MERGIKSTHTCGTVNVSRLKTVSFISSDKYLAVCPLLFLSRSPQRHMLSVKESMKAL